MSTIKTVKKIKGCTCVKQVNEKLKEFNTELDTCLSLSMSDMKASASLVIASRKIDSKKRGSAKTVFPRYCPFCGKKF